jgi:hypothetical protein
VTHRLSVLPQRPCCHTAVATATQISPAAELDPWWLLPVASGVIVLVLALLIALFASLVVLLVTTSSQKQ